MKFRMKTTTILFGLWALLGLSTGYSFAAAQSSNSLTMEILSAKTLNGTAGDFVSVQAQIKNTDKQPIDNISTYLSMVDENTKLPVDLEDWSAEKGQFIGSIDTGQTLPLNWKIHFVTPGNYSLIIVAETQGQDIPQSSTITHFHVNPKRNLNPGQVLPVALGTPIVLLFIMAFLTYKRNSVVN
jgi:hypothetical protein